MAATHSLTILEKKVLYLLSIDAGTPVIKLATALGCKPYLVQLACKKFNKLSLLSRRLMIDTFRLGYNKHSFLISLSSDGKATQPELTRFLNGCGNISSVTELDSGYDLLVEVVSRSSEEFWDLQSRLSSRFPTTIHDKEIAVVTRQTVFGERYLFPERILSSESTYQVSSRLVHTDEFDREILFAISRPGFESLARLSREMSVPFSTLDYRMKKLRERGVICGDLLNIDANRISAQRGLVLVGMRGFPRGLRPLLHEYLAQQPHVTSYSEQIGTWDYVIGVAGFRARQFDNISLSLLGSRTSPANQEDVTIQQPHFVSKLTERLQSSFSEYIARLKYLPVSKIHKLMDYPITPKSRIEIERAGNT